MKVNTEKFSFDGSVKRELVFQVDTHVLTLDRNQLNNYGYFTDKTYEGLIKQIKSKCEEYLSKELVEEKLIISYCIDTVCSYCTTSSGEIVPNGTYDKSYGWKEGTKNDSFNHHEPFTVAVSAVIYNKKVYKFKIGKEKIEYLKPNSNELGEFGKWILNITHIGIGKNGKQQEIEYNEETALFFVSMLKSICNINEKIKDFISPDAIKLLISNGQKLIG